MIAIRKKMGRQNAVLQSAFWATALLSGLSGCTAILDFSAPIEANDAGFDGNVVIPDAAIDAEIAVTCDTAALVHEPNDSIKQATAISGTLDSFYCSESGPDIDLFQFSVDGDDVEIILTMPGNADLDLRLRASNNSIRSESTGDGATEVLRHTGADGNRLAPGTYFIEVFSETASASEAYSIQLILSNVM